MGSQQIRNVASVGGNIVSAFPNSDLNPVLAAGNCRVSLISAGEWPPFSLLQRESENKELADLRCDALSVLQGEFVGALRQAPRKEASFATVTTGMRVRFSEGSRVVEDVSIYYGGMGPTTIGAPKTCKAIQGRWEQLFLFSTSVTSSLLLFPLGAEGGLCLTAVSLQAVGRGNPDPGLRRPPGGAGPPSFCPRREDCDGKVCFFPSRSSHYAANACLLPLCQLQGAAVTTVEGVGSSRTRIHPVQERIAKAHGSQCGFCTPGMVMSMYALLRNQPQPSMEDITQALAAQLLLSGNMCRCTGYRPIVDGCRTFCQEADCCRANGGAQCCLNGEEKAAGAEDSLAFLGERMSWLAPVSLEELVQLKARHPAAPLLMGNTNIGPDMKFKGVFHPLVISPMRVQELLEVSESPEGLFVWQDAVQKASFFQPRRVIERGSVEEAFTKADRIHEGGIRIGGQEHFYMETQSMLVVPVGEETEFNVYISTQWPALIQDAISETLNIPANRVTCHVKRLGGAFGGKVIKTSILASITSVAAWKTNRAVRCVLERGEDMLITGGRHPVRATYKVQGGGGIQQPVGFMEDGRIVAADLEYFSNAGFAVDESVLVSGGALLPPAGLEGIVEKILLHMDNAYNIPNLRGRAAACRTNLPSNTSFRGFGVPQSLLVIREINMYKGPSITHYKFEFSPENMLRCWEECKRRSDYSGRRSALQQFNQQSRWRKRGMAIVPIKYGIAFSEGFLNQGAALVHIYKDGSVLVTHGGTEMGQGIHTKMQQVASRELRVPTSKVYISETSTGTVPNTCPSAASFGTDANGMAVKINAAYFEKISLSATGYFRGPDLYMDWDKMEGQPYAYYTFGTCCSEVELDCLTGDYRTVRTDIVIDMGRSVNPSVDFGQIEGAFMQGLGLYTLEELKFSPTGVLYTRGPSQYKIPAVCDVPLSFNVYMLPDSDNPHAIYSSKGIGEPIIFLGSSVFFAIKDAVAAARSASGLSGPFALDSPATPERACLACASPACLACASPFTQKIPVSEPGTFKPWALNI
ncbi:unnamed protein product [Menidia menidia]|uniref:(Atlantic silverside) hypothetical protein n=1 Tax=Menidia menidia TaxID=238744 RepID=A0A8S4BEW7_9TELE|nr:unnamed protein product [Menidia menidia]